MARLTAEQRQNRDQALVRNLRFSHPECAPYSDQALIRAYDAWFMADESSDESQFLEFLYDFA